MSRNSSWSDVMDLSTLCSHRSSTSGSLPRRPRWPGHIRGRDHRRFRAWAGMAPASSTSAIPRCSARTWAMASGKERMRARPYPRCRPPPMPLSCPATSRSRSVGVKGEGRRRIMRDQPPHRLRDRSRIAAGLADVGEDLKGLIITVDIHRDKGRSQWRCHAIRHPLDFTWPGFDNLALAFGRWRLSHPWPPCTAGPSAAGVAFPAVPTCRT